MGLFKKIFQFVNIIKDNGEKSDNLPILENLFEISTPMYLIDENFDLVWFNKEFNLLVHSDNSKKCYETIFGSQTICLNCPAVKSLQTQQINESYVSWIKQASKKNIVKITSLPLHFNGKVYVLNSLIALPDINSSPKDEKDVFSKGEIADKKNYLITLIEQVPFPIMLVRRDLSIVFANETAKTEFKLFNLSETNLSLPNFLKSLDESDFGQLILNVLNNKSHLFRVSLENGTDAKEKTYVCKMFKISNDEDLFVMVFKNLSEDQDIDVQNVINSELFDKVLQRINLGIVLQDGLNRIIFQNRVAQELLENNTELKNQLVLKKLSANDGSEINFKFPTLGSDSRIFDVTLSECVLDRTNEKFSLVELEDITELEDLRKSLEQIKKQIEPIEKNIHFASFKLMSDYSITDVFGKFHYFDVDNLFHKNKLNFIEELVFPEDSFKVSETFSELFHFPNITKTLEFRLKSLEGDGFWVKGVFENVVDERGKILHVECFLLDINEQKKVEEQLKASQEEMRNLAMYFESLREDEKKKLAFEIHDELGHLLTAMKLEMAWLMKKKYLREDVLNEKLLKLTEMVETTIRKVRSISSQLRPSILDHFGIVAAIEWQANEFQRQTAIRCRINLPKQELQLDEQKSIVVFRVFQEILTNIARHAKATRVDVNLDVVDNNLILTVSDNGKGIRPEDISAKKSLGIIGMKERATSVNGKLTIHGVSNIGTTVTLTIPIK